MKKYKSIFLILGCLSSLLYSQAGSINSRIIDLASKKQYAEAISLQLEALKGDSLNGEMMYNLSCMNSLANNRAEALNWLEKAVENGYTNYLSIKKDPDLNKINALPEFDKLIGLARKTISEDSKAAAVTLREGEWKRFEIKGSYLLPKVNASLEYDSDALRIHALVQDNHFKDKDRAWRYGDGFFINLAFPSPDDSVDTDKFLAFGFSMENKKPVSLLVNKDGEYFLKKTSQVSNEILVDSLNHEAQYHISIPWPVLYPFNPLMHEKAGINIIYVSQNDDHSRKILKYIDDPYYDTEATSRRRFAPLNFVLSDKSRLKVAGELESTLVTKPSGMLSLAVYSPEKLSSEISVVITDSTGRKISEKKIAYNYPAGKNIISQEIDFPENEGVYKITVSLKDSTKWSDSFLRFNSGLVNDFRNEIKSIPSSGDKMLTNSIAAINYYVDELEKTISAFSKRKDPLAIKNKISEIKHFINMCRVNKTVYRVPGFMQSAFISKADNSVQPFSVYLPEEFDTEKEYNLIVALHGSGEDEYWTVMSRGRELCGKDNIVIGPRGRDLSSWYTGRTEEDVISLIETAKEMFKIKKTFLYGFSMGGYGTWRISFLHPEFFDGAVIVSGVPFNLVNNEPANDMNTYIGKARNLSFLVIHGTDDRSLEIKYTDDFIASLGKENYDVKYIKIPGGGHGNFKSGDMIKEWLFSRLGK